MRALKPLPTFKATFHRWEVGLDEVGAGALAGPIVAAAVAWRPGELQWPKEIRDSKLLSPAQRQAQWLWIQKSLPVYGLGQASSEEVDRLNPLQASLLAMERAAQQLPPWLLKEGAQFWVDGRYSPNLPGPCHCLVGGDRKVPLISAASIVAKVNRDCWMVEQAAVHYPHYGFESHKGYGVARHLQALQRWGPCALHRLSYAPVRNWKPIQLRVD